MMNSKFAATLILGFVLVLIICGAWGDYILDIGAGIGLSMEETSIGDWGDSFSALNTAFSGFAFVGIAGTIFLQVRATKERTNERGREEFERVFFQIFGLIRELRKEIEFEPAPAKVSGVSPRPIVGTGAVGVSLAAKSATPITKYGNDAIKAAYNEVKRAFSRSSRPDLQRSYKVIVNRKSEAAFSPYFRAVYSLLRKIHGSTFLTMPEKLEYSRLLRSQMTSYEAAILGINGLTKESKDLRDYIIFFRMPKYCKAGEIREALKEHYPIDAFRGRE